MPVALFATVALVAAACSGTAPPTTEPTAEPSEAPTLAPSLTPAPTPSLATSPDPTPAPTAEPTPEPTSMPEPTPAPTPEPTPEPTLEPTPEPSPSPSPTLEPTPEPSPSPSPTLEPFPPDLEEVGGYAIDPATNLPIVPEAEGGPWWWVDPPELLIDPSLRFTSDAPPATDVDPDQGRVTLLAEYDSHAEALAVGVELSEAVGDPAAEMAWLEARGQSTEGGFDWLGSEAATTPFVDVIDRWLIVSELAYRDELDPGPELDVVPRYASPLAQALYEDAAQLIVEETSSADKHVAFDVACSGDPTMLLTLQQDLADNGELYDMQPVWLEPGITSEQRFARRTLRLLDTLASDVLAALPDDIVFQRLAQTLRDAGDRGLTATDESFDDLRLYIENLIVTTRPDLEPLVEYLDPVVVETAGAAIAQRAAWQVLAGRETRPPNVASGQFAASRYGAHQSDVPWLMGDARSYVGLGYTELTMSLGLFHGVAAGLGPMIEYLDEHGCDEIRIAFNDYGVGLSQLDEDPGAVEDEDPDAGDDEA